MSGRESTLLVIPTAGGHLYALVDSNRAVELGGIDLPLMFKDLLPERKDGKPRLDLFINTHPHSDHLGGLAELREQLYINEVWHSGHNPGPEHNGAYLELKALIREVKTRGGDKQLKGSCSPVFLGNASIDVVSPAQYVADEIAEEKNRYKRIHEQCAVLRVRYGNMMTQTGVLITGDSDRTAWEQHITDYHGNLGDNRICAQVLSASHHGSITFFKDRDDEYEDPYMKHLERIAPTHVVISAPDSKDSKYGHPHDESVQYYQTEVNKRAGKIHHMGSLGWSFILDVYDSGQHNMYSDRGRLKKAYCIGGNGDGSKVEKVPAIISNIEHSRPMGEE
jgi:competence protein ComEC